MGNRSFLYAIPAQGDDGGLQIAEANNNFPTLWQLLLASGSNTTAIRDQRVFGDANTDNLAADADQALERLERLTHCLQQHPRLHEQPLLMLQLDALNTHLRNVVDDLKAETGGGVLFSANLDELSWLQEDSPQAFIEQCRDECNALWTRLNDAINAGQYAEIDEALGLLEHGYDFAIWDAWEYAFGFGGIEHDYFSQTDTPRTIPFAAFKPEPRSWENQLEGDFERFEQNGLWGVRWRNYETEQTRDVLAPEWENISSSGAGGVWVQRDGLYGFARLRAEAMQLELAPQLDEVWGFTRDDEDETSACAIVRRGGQQGILSAEGTWLLEPSVDEIWGFDYGLAPFRQGESYGFVDRTGRIAITATFEDVGSFCSPGLAPAWREGRVGLIDKRGQWVLSPDYDGIEWREDFRGFLITHNDKVGLVNATGAPWIEPLFDELTVLITRCLIGVRQNDLWGSLDWNGKVAAPVRFHTIEPRYFDDLGFDDARFALVQPWHKHCIVRIDKHVGLIDANGVELVPIRYDAVESFETQTITTGTQEHFSQCVCVVQRGPRRRKLRGIFDLAAQRELVPCQWHHILPCLFDDQHRGFLVGLDIPKADQDRLGEVRTGVLNADGSELYPPEYAWIADRIALNGDAWLHAILRKRLHEAWSAGRPAQAVPNESGVYVWLHRDGRIESHLDYLCRSYQETGDLEMALEIGRAFRDGINAPADPQQARHWLWIATGAEMEANSKPLWKKVAQKLGYKAASETRIAEPAPSSRPRNITAMYELALLLENNQGGPEQASTARNWLRFALDHGGEQHHRILAELGYLLSEGIGGPAARTEGRALYERAAEHGSSIALHNLGIIYQFGQEVEVDLQQALTYYRKAEKNGDKGSIYHVGVVLAEQARSLTGAARRRKLSEAAYELSRIIHDDIEHTYLACAEYARICLDPDAREFDPAAAETVLLRGAQADDLNCIELLTDELYGNPESGLHNPEQHAFWSARKVQLESENA